MLDLLCIVLTVAFFAAGATLTRACGRQHARARVLGHWPARKPAAPHRVRRFESDAGSAALAARGEFPLAAWRDEVTSWS